MLKSELIIVDGVFVGAVMHRTSCDRLEFYSAHERVRALHGKQFPTRELALKRARTMYLSGKTYHPDPASRPGHQ